jgi:hypothetical protein
MTDKRYYGKGKRVPVLALKMYMRSASTVGLFLTLELSRVQIHAGLWIRYTKLPTQTPTPTATPQFLRLRLRFQLFRKISICINNGKPIRRFITTT